MTQLVHVSNIAKKYKEQVVLDAISFSINSGELFSILGPNGAGKSTLISIILGLVKADTGEIILAGKRCIHTLSSINH
ncbi:ATP-binding cassette domain-containing protein [Enterococcus termitis]